MTHWTDTAACRGADTAIFFPESGATKPDVDYVLDTFCRRCPAVAACLAQADQEEPTHADINGIRGGLTRAQRRTRLTKRQADKERAATLAPLHSTCGTYAGYMRHRRTRTEMCAACRDARDTYQREYKARVRAGVPA